MSLPLPIRGYLAGREECNPFTGVARRLLSVFIRNDISFCTGLKTTEEFLFEFRIFTGVARRPLSVFIRNEISFCTGLKLQRNFFLNFGIYTKVTTLFVKAIFIHTHVASPKTHV